MFLLIFYIGWIMFMVSGVVSRVVDTHKTLTNITLKLLGITLITLSIVIKLQQLLY